jgi:hypothetical protein
MNFSLCLQTVLLIFVHIVIVTAQQQQQLPIARIARVSANDCSPANSAVLSTHYLFDNILRYDQLPTLFVVQVDQSRAVANATVEIKRVGGDYETLRSGTGNNGVITFASPTAGACGIVSLGVERIRFKINGNADVAALWLVTQFGAAEMPQPSYPSVTQAGSIAGIVAPPRALAVFDVDGDGFDDLVAASEPSNLAAVDQYVQVCRSVPPPQIACANVTVLATVCTAAVALFGSDLSPCLQEAIIAVCMASVMHCAGVGNSVSACRIRAPLPRRVLECKLVASAGVDDIAFFHRPPVTYGAFVRQTRFGLVRLTPTNLTEVNFTAVADPVLNSVPSVLAYDANDDQMIDFNALSLSKRWIGQVGANIAFLNLTASGLPTLNRHSIGITRPPPLRTVSVLQREQFRVVNGTLSSIGRLDGINVCIFGDENLSHLWVDCDNDGDQDVVVACKQYLVVFVNSNGVLAGRLPPLNVGDNRKVVSATVGDLNRDGFMDIGGSMSQVVDGTRSGTQFAAYGFGECRFEIQAGNAIANENNAFATMIDVDGDGDIDVASVLGAGAVFLTYATEPGSAGALRTDNGTARALVAWPDTLRVKLNDIHDIRTPFLSYVELHDSATGALVAAQQLSPSFGNLKPSATLMFNTGDMVRWYTADGAPRRFVDVVVYFASDLIRNVPTEVPTIVTAVHWSDKLVTVAQGNTKRVHMRNVLPPLNSTSLRGDVMALEPPANTPTNHAAYKFDLVCISTAAANDIYPFAVRVFRVRVLRSEPTNATTSFDVGGRRTPITDVLFADATVDAAANGLTVKLFSTASSVVLGVAPMFSLNDDRMAPETSTGVIVFPRGAPTAPPTPPPTTRTPTTTRADTTSSAAASPSETASTMATTATDDMTGKIKSGLGQETKDNNLAIIVSVSVIGGIVVLATIIGMVVCYRAKHKYRAEARARRRLGRVDSAVDVPDVATMKTLNSAPNTNTAPLAASKNSNYTIAPPLLQHQQYDAPPPPHVMYGAAPEETSEFARGGGGGGDTATTSSSRSSHKRPKKRSDGYEIAPDLEVDDDNA